MARRHRSTIDLGQRTHAEPLDLGDAGGDAAIDFSAMDAAPHVGRPSFIDMDDLPSMDWSRGPSRKASARRPESTSRQSSTSSYDPSPRGQAVTAAGGGYLEDEVFGLEEVGEEAEDPIRAEGYISVGNEEGGRGGLRRRSSVIGDVREFSEANVVRSGWKGTDPNDRRGSKQLRKREVGQGLRNLCENCLNKGDRTYLAVAQCGKSRCLHILRMLDKWRVETAPPMNVRDGTGATPSHYAARNNNTDFLQWIIESGANLKSEAKNGALPVHDAAATGSLDALQVLLFHDETAVRNTLTGSEFLPLHLAANFGHLITVGWLIEKGLNAPDATSANGSTALHFAAQAGHFDVVGYLLEYLPKGAVNSRNVDGVTPFYLAAENNHVDVLRLLREHGAKWDVDAAGTIAIHAAAKTGALQAVQFCLAMDKMALTALSLEGESTLHFAAKSGNVGLMRLLLRERSKRDSVQQKLIWSDQEGWTPVHDAAAAGHRDIINLFVEQGISLSETTNDGANAADIARENGHAETAILLALKV